MSGGQPITSGRRADDLAIVDYHIEDREGGSFDLLTRRKFGIGAVLIFIMLVAFAAVGAWMLWGIVGGFIRELMKTNPNAVPPATMATTMGSRGKGGSMFCPAVITTVFMSVWFTIIYKNARAHWDRLRGRERWLFGIGGITPPGSVYNREKSIAFFEPSATRCGVTQIGKRAVVGITSGKQELIIGPFDDWELAHRLAHDVERRRPGWFGHGAYGIEQITPLDPKVLQDSIIKIEAIERDAHRLVIEVKRKRPPHRPGNYFLIFWLCGWGVGELFAGRLLMFEALYRVGLVEHPIVSATGKKPPIIFLGVWFAIWTIAGILAMRNLRLRYRTRELWRFDSDQIVADPNWQFTARRRLNVDDDMTVRRVGSNIEFVSRGASLSLGPLMDFAVGEKLMRDLHPQQPSWTWQFE